MVNVIAGKFSGNNRFSKVRFLGNPREDAINPLAIMCDVYNRKSRFNATGLVPVSDWQHTCNHGYLTTTIAHAVCPEAEIRAFDFRPDCADEGNEDELIRNKARQITKVIEEAINIKRQNPERPVSINFSIIFDIESNQNTKQFCRGEDLNSCKTKVKQAKYRNMPEVEKMYSVMSEFLGMGKTKIFVAAGNSPDNLNMLLFADGKNLNGVFGTNNHDVRLPFFAFNDLTNKGGQAMYNVYESEDGKQYLKIKGEKIELFDGFKVYPEFEMNRVQTILGEDLKGKNFNDIKHRLMSVKDLIKESGDEFTNLPGYMKEYLEDKKDLFIPVGWGIDTLEGYHLCSHGLFFGVDDDGMVYWSPDGSENQKGEKVVGFIKGTSFAAPTRMMQEFSDLITGKPNVSFTGNIKFAANRQKVSLHNLAYSMKAYS